MELKNGMKVKIKNGRGYRTPPNESLIYIITDIDYLPRNDMIWCRALGYEKSLNGEYSNCWRREDITPVHTRPYLSNQGTEAWY